MARVILVGEPEGRRAMASIERVASVVSSGWFLAAGCAAGAIVAWLLADGWQPLWAAAGVVVGLLVVSVIGGMAVGLLGAVADGRGSFRVLDRSRGSAVFSFWWGYTLIPATMCAVVVGVVASPSILWGVGLVPLAVVVGWVSWLIAGVVIGDRLDRRREAAR